MINSSLKGKIVLITGGTGGIGKQTALELAKMGASVTIVGRNPQKTAETTEELRRVSGNPDIEYLVGDLSSQAEVRRVAGEFRARHDRLNVLVNNAGAVFMQRHVTVDGYEMTFALNHLAYFLLTYLLLDLLEAGAPSRIVNVSSAAHMAGKIHFDDLQLEQGYNGWKAYSQSKLANVLFTYELSRRLQGTGVTANALHPGFVATNFGRSNGGFFNPLFKLFQVGAISPEKGAETPIYLASSPDMEGVTGKYFTRKKAVQSTPASYDMDAARRLWEESLELTGVKQPENAA